MDAMSHGIERDLLPRAIYELAELAFSAVEFLQLTWSGEDQAPPYLSESQYPHAGSRLGGKAFGYKSFCRG